MISALWRGTRRSSTCSWSVLLGEVFCHRHEDVHGAVPWLRSDGGIGRVWEFRAELTGALPCLP